MYVCLGNICRSPLAEAVMRNKVRKMGWDSQVYIESSGTSAYHIGEDADQRTLHVAKSHDVPMNHKAQQLQSKHFLEFDYLIFMDDSNAENANKISPPKASCTVFKMRDFDTQSKGSDVIDPWFGDDAGFETCYQTVNRCNDAFLQFLNNKHIVTTS